VDVRRKLDQREDGEEVDKCQGRHQNDGSVKDKASHSYLP
jgi:hypothetical protein